MTARLSTGLSREDLTDGFATPVELGDTKVLLIRLGEEVRAVSAWCTHMHTLIGEQPVAEDGLLECPLHGAIFDSADGSQQLGPACDALPVYEVEIDSAGAVTVTVTGKSPRTPARRAPSFWAWDASDS
jgi:apoptosis-inducing factor 3